MKKNPDKLRIGVICSVSLPIPPFQGYGGTQRGVYDFVKRMGSRGHDVQLYGPGDSDAKNLEGVTLQSFVEKSLWSADNDESLEEKSRLSKLHYKRSLEHMAKADREEPFDIINVRTDNVETLEKTVQAFGPRRIVYGLHNLKNQARINVIQQLGVQCVAHCHDHRASYEGLPNISVVTYGVDVDSHPFSKKTLKETDEEPTIAMLQEIKSKNQDYLISLGAVGPHKGQRTSIELARRANIPLIIAGAPQVRRKTENLHYHEQQVIPNIDGENIYYFGNADEQQKMELLRFAKGFLFPSGFEDRRWSEPFGRAPVEALSCGVPVIAYRKGSMPEVVMPNMNGFLFEDIEEAVGQVLRLDTIKRENCREVAKRCFDSERVADDYERLMYRVVSKNKPFKKR